MIPKLIKKINEINKKDLLKKKSEKWYEKLTLNGMCKAVWVDL